MTCPSSAGGLQSADNEVSLDISDRSQGNELSYDGSGTDEDIPSSDGAENFVQLEARSADSIMTVGRIQQERITQAQDSSPKWKV